ncbi:MAG TPA: tryptophan halogenase family protein [Steroidobacteraceae bacterium]|nr:tryptophan halogenase family protein [Steroidobacteraceae bacterium]
MSNAVRRVVIAGGGTAGWMTATALSHAFSRKPLDITLVESEEIGSVGVGEATIPTLHYFNSTFGIDQRDFVCESGGTFKLGIEFVDWGDIGRRYIHPFAPYGRDLNNIFFHELWMKYAKRRADADASCLIDDYNICCVAAKAGRFKHPVSGESSVAGTLKYAFHFDASLYARYLRRLCEAKDVRRVEGRIVNVFQNSGNGHIESLTLADGRKIEGDLFIDCTGQRAMLIGQTLGSGFEDWRSWLPCDTAIAVPSAHVEPPLPYTRSSADAAGWRWRIPLQHRIGNGYVYSSAHIGHDEAERRLLACLDGAPLASPRRIPFRTGRRKVFWIGNCVAIGLAAGFLEPLESTSIHLIQTAVFKLLALFPDLNFDQADINAFNRHTISEYERIRDFLILHYKITQRSDTSFWRYCAEMIVPDSVRENIELFESRGRMFISADHLFTGQSWLSVMLGQGLRPRGYDPLVDALTDEELDAHMNFVRDGITRAVAAMPNHADYVEHFCRAPRP